MDMACYYRDWWQRCAFVVILTTKSPVPCLRCRTSSPCLLLGFPPCFAQSVLAPCQGDRQSPAGHLLSAQASCSGYTGGLCKQEQSPFKPWGMNNDCYLLGCFDSNTFDLWCNQAPVHSRAKWSMIFKLSKHGDNEEVAQLLRWKMLAVEDLVHMHSHTFIGRKKVSF